jgi:hypothetical protein
MGFYINLRFHLSLVNAQEWNQYINGKCTLNCTRGFQMVFKNPHQHHVFQSLYILLSTWCWEYFVRTILSTDSMFNWVIPIDYVGLSVSVNLHFYIDIEHFKKFLSAICISSLLTYLFKSFAYLLKIVSSLSFESSSYKNFYSSNGILKAQRELINECKVIYCQNKTACEAAGGWKKRKHWSRDGTKCLPAPPSPPCSAARLWEDGWSSLTLKCLGLLHRFLHGSPFGLLTNSLLLKKTPKMVGSSHTPDLHIWMS